MAHKLTDMAKLVLFPQALQAVPDRYYGCCHTSAVPLPPSSTVTCIVLSVENPPKGVGINFVVSVWMANMPSPVHSRISSNTSNTSVYEKALPHDNDLLSENSRL